MIEVKRFGGDAPLDIEGFAQHHGLVLVIEERATSSNLGVRMQFCTRLSTANNGHVTNDYGNGPTPDAAIADYTQKIRGMRIRRSQFGYQGHDIDVPNDLTASPVVDLAAELREARALLADIAGDYERMAAVPPRDPDFAADVCRLGDRIGYGALMSEASRSWRTRLVDDGCPPGGEYVSGPCRAVAEGTLSKIRAFIERGAHKAVKP